MLWLRGSSSSTDKEYEELCEENVKREKERESLLKALHMPSVWKPFLILLVFFAFQQMSGIYIILFYTVNILEDIGIELNEYSASVGIGVIRLFASIAGAGLANSFGRKTLAFLSGLGMTVSAVGVALAYRLVRYDRNAFGFRKGKTLCSYLQSSSSVFVPNYLPLVIDIDLRKSNRSNFFFQAQMAVCGILSVHRRPRGFLYVRISHLTLGNDL